MASRLRARAVGSVRGYGPVFGAVESYVHEFPFIFR